jgi:adenine-specific DNA-methyltransferase|tara:strand:- start:95 stop:337 length:243 start_codon:yes stop_codon:yes gene_type:complete
LYAVEDAFRFSVSENKHAIIVDFFVDSRNTTHAVKRLNKQDGGRRPCIFITNNEVAASEYKKMREAELRPGDAKWEMGYL